MTTETEDEIVVSPVVVFLQKNGKWFYPFALVLIIVVVGGGIWLNNRPAQGTWRYGVCRALMDYEYSFPPTYDVLSVEEQETSTRFYMAETNPFGNERIIQIDCDYQINGNSVKLARLSLDRKPIPAERVAYYNKLVPILLRTKLNTELPPPLPAALSQLKR